MSGICVNLSPIRGFILDVDGVLSHNTLALDCYGNPLRTANVKDGFAIRLALRLGYTVAIITGGDNLPTALRMRHLGVTDFFNRSRNKLSDYEQIKKKYGFLDEQLAYIGDDLPDLEVMKLCGLAIAPRDAAPEIREIAHYVSPYNGGDGVVRDVIEQALRAQGNWHLDAVDLDW